MDRRVRVVLDMLESQAGRKWSVEELAIRVGLRPSRLEHLVRVHANTTIRDFLREQRLVKAAGLIVSTWERISIISFSVGYPDVSNFNHAFKKRFGMSPRAYRVAAIADFTND